MRTYFCGIKTTPHYRRSIFESGLSRHGLKPTHKANKADVFVCWNRYGVNDLIAKEVEKRGGKVIIAENASWGNTFAGADWYTLANSYHNLSGYFKVFGADRWDSLGVSLKPFRDQGGEVVGLPQRGIGCEKNAMPRSWVPPGCTRIRRHPGTRPSVALDVDLAKTSKVVTWGSGAAIKALMLGIHVQSYLPNWIGEQDNTDSGRLTMFRRLAWAQWRTTEIESGEAFVNLI